jgi:hypothetical protein
VRIVARPRIDTARRSLASRMVLRLISEREYPVGPLALPTDNCGDTERGLLLAGKRGSGRGLIAIAAEQCAFRLVVGRGLLSRGSCRVCA